MSELNIQTKLFENIKNLIRKQETSLPYAKGKWKKERSRDLEDHMQISTKSLCDY